MVYPLGKFPIITFEEYISIALDAQRVVGIYPEMKNPVFINQHVSNFSSQLSQEMVAQSKLLLLKTR